MTMQIPLTSTANLSLSASRISKLMSGDFQAATKMGAFDKFLDIFRSSSKESALKTIYEMVQNRGTSNFDRFNYLSQITSQTSNTAFTVEITPHDTDSHSHNILYCIDGKAVKSDVINTQEKIVISQKMGKPLDAASIQAKVATIDTYKINTEAEVQTVKDADFSAGGVNKTFHPSTGLLRAQTRTGEEDFEREAKLSEYANAKTEAGNPELASYISTQRRCETPPPHLDKSFQYAIVDVYNKDVVKSTEMDSCIDGLSREQAHSLLPQLVDMARVLYKNEVAHRDLHMHNLVIHQVKDTGSVHLKAIDFGRLAIGSDFEAKKFEDVQYLFSKKGSTFLETIGRNYLSRDGSEVDKKHYPIHKLCEKFNDRGINLDSVLSNIGDRLIHDLGHAGDDEDLVDAAFFKASETLQQTFVQLEQNNFMGISFA